MQVWGQTSLGLNPDSYSLPLGLQAQFPDELYGEGGELISIQKGWGENPACAERLPAAGQTRFPSLFQH